MSFEGFRRTGGEATLVPVWKDCLLDTDTPVSAFAKLRDGPFAFLLESAPAGGETWSRYTFLGSAPRSAWRLRDGGVAARTPAVAPCPRGRCRASPPAGAERGASSATTPSA